MNSRLPPPASLASNISALFVIQAFAYIIPLISIPYLVRILGPERYGAVAFAQAFVQYFIVFTDYGFQYTATRQMAMEREDARRRAEILSTVLVAKFALAAIGLAVFIAIVIWVPRFREDWLLYLLASVAVIGSALHPGWLFQGLEKMRYLAVVNVVAQLIVLGSILLLVAEPSDYYLAVSLQAVGGIVAALLAFYIITTRQMAGISAPRWRDIRREIRDGWHVFLSTAAVTLYTTSNVFVLGLMTNTTTVAYFSAAERLIRALHGLIVPFTQAIYPRVSRLMATSRESAFALLDRALKRLGGYALVLSLLVLTLAPSMVDMLYGEQFDSSAELVRWMSFVPLVVLVSNIFGVQTLLALGMRRAFSRIIVGFGLLNLVAVVPAVFYFEATGAAVATLVTETLVALAMALVLWRQGIRFWVPVKGCHVD